jgi:hypothetical protein
MCSFCATLYIYTYISKPGSRVKLPEADSRARLVRVWAPLEWGITTVNFTLSIPLCIII